jgi:hypothetical protein
MRILRRHSPFSAAIFAIFLFALSTSAQGPPPSTASDAGPTNTATQSSDQTASGSSNTPTGTATPTGSNSGPTNSGSTNSASGTASATQTNTTPVSAPPPLTTSTSSSADSTDLPGLPTLPTLPGGEVVSYPPPTVPPTAGAPYMQHSNLPEGTVFIAVGAVLGFLGLAVLAWRGLVAWSLHRSVKRAATQNNLADSKAMLRPPGGGIYANVYGSSLSLDHLSSSGKSPGAQRHTPNSSLFFSPTATTGAGLGQAGNRGSGYLPAGYYAAGNAAPGGGTGMTHIGGGAPVGLSTHNYARAKSVGPSPPGSPSLPPSRSGDAGFARGSLRNGTSMSSLNLPAQQQERAPSAYLEDLFENHQPGQMPGGGNVRF